MNRVINVIVITYYIMDVKIKHHPSH